MIYSDGVWMSARMQPPCDFQVFEQGQFRIGMGDLHQISNFPPRLRMTHVHPGLKHPSITGGRFDHPKQHTDGGGFPCAIQAKKSVDLTFCDTDRKVLDSFHVCIMFSEIFSFNDPGHFLFCRALIGTGEKPNSTKQYHNMGVSDRFESNRDN